MNGFKPAASTAAWLAVCLLVFPIRVAAATDAAPDRDAAHKAVVAASIAGDYVTALRLGREWFARHPTDLDFVMNMPIYAKSGGEIAEWNKWREALTANWATLDTSEKLSKSPGFGVDTIKVGTDKLVYVMQCYETAGEFGVSYKFNVLSATTGNLLSFFTVESGVTDNQLAKELGRPWPVFTLDYFPPFGHQTLAMLHSKPDYDDLRKRVEAHLADPRALSASGNGGQGLSDEGCEFAR